jgi:hypothetical protein
MINIFVVFSFNLYLSRHCCFEHDLCDTNLSYSATGLLFVVDIKIAQISPAED